MARGKKKENPVQRERGTSTSIFGQHPRGNKRRIHRVRNFRREGKLLEHRLWEKKKRPTNGQFRGKKKGVPLTRGKGGKDLSMRPEEK